MSRWVLNLHVRHRGDFTTACWPPFPGAAGALDKGGLECAFLSFQVILMLFFGDHTQRMLYCIMLLQPLYIFLAIFICVSDHLTWSQRIRRSNWVWNLILCEHWEPQLWVARYFPTFSQSIGNTPSTKVHMKVVIDLYMSKILWSGNQTTLSANQLGSGCFCVHIYTPSIELIDLKETIMTFGDFTASRGKGKNHGYLVVKVNSGKVIMSFIHPKAKGT